MLKLREFFSQKSTSVMQHDVHKYAAFIHHSTLRIHEHSELLLGETDIPLDVSLVLHNAFLCSINHDFDITTVCRR